MDIPLRPQDLWAGFDFPRHPLAREDGERLIPAGVTSLEEVLRVTREG